MLVPAIGQFLSNSEQKHIYMKRWLFSLLVFVYSPLLYAQGIAGAIMINNGSSVTNEQEGKVNIALRSAGATHMRISRDESFRGAVWEPYSYEKRGFYLLRKGEGDGVKTVYVTFKDAAGNISEVVSASIEIDRTPPLEPSVMINGGLPYTNNKMRTVQLDISAKEANMMQIGTKPDFYGSNWEVYKERVENFRLPGEEGKKEVYIRFKDLAGNVSPIVNTSIILDLTPPSNVGLAINDGERFIKSEKVRLKLKADGASHMQIRGGEGWLPLQTEIDWELPAGDGEKVVYARFQDEVGNLSTVAVARTILDTTPPSFAKLTINKGIRYIDTHIKQPVSVLAQGASEMMLSNYADFRDGRWEPYKPQALWTFLDGEGKKVLYARFKDLAGNESEVVSASVILDRTPPAEPMVRIKAENSVYDSINQVTLLRDEAKVVDLEFTCEDAKFMMVSNQSNFYAASWQLYTPKVTGYELGGAEDGYRTVYVKFMDKARNVTEAVKDRVMVDTQPPNNCQITINNNEEHTIQSEKRVNLKLFAQGADEMMLSNDPTFDKASWEPYKQYRDWVLEGNDGIKTVFVRYRDRANNISQTVSDNIILDRKPPFNCSLVINKEAEETNNPDKVVQLRLRAEDAVKMQVSNLADFKDGRWVAYTPLNMPWVLLGNDGPKSVYARFMDAAGNISEVAKDDILLDRTPPLEGTVVINGKEKLTNDNRVSLVLSARGAKDMMLSSRFDFKDAEWEPYKESRQWSFIGQDGLKFVYAKFRDGVGNISRPSFDRIGVDTEAPKGGTIMINKGEKYCTDIDGKVILRLNAFQAAKMMVSNSATFEGAKWEPFNYVVYDYRLDTQEDGEKKVYAKFADNANNETPAIVASVQLDRQEPVSERIKINNGEQYTNVRDGAVNLDIFAEGATMMQVSNSRFFDALTKWVPYATSINNWRLDITKDGNKYVYVRFKDEADNISAIATGTIIYDTTPPMPLSVKVNNGQTAVDTPHVKLNIAAKDAAYMMVSNSPRFDGALWQPYKEVLDWTLPAGQGLKRIYVKFKDQAQNESGSKFGEVTLYQAE